MSESAKGLKGLFARMHEASRQWRAAHPDATLDEIAAQVTPRRRELMGALLGVGRAKGQWLHPRGAEATICLRMDPEAEAERLAVLGIANPAQPTLVGRTGVPPGVVCDVAVSGTPAYVAAGYMGLRIVDVSNPAAPRELGFYNTPGYAQSVAVAGTFVYVADGSGGLLILRYVPPGNVSLFLPLVLKGR